MRRFTRRTAAISLTAAVAVSGSVAYAAWTANGTGSGAARAGQAVLLETEAATTGTLLYPGGSADVKIKIRNKNPYPIQITVVLENGSIVVDSAHSGCIAHAVSVPLPQIVAWQVGPDDADEFTLPKPARMGNSDNACQGATFTIPVQLAGTSNA